MGSETGSPPRESETGFTRREVYGSEFHQDDGFVPPPLFVGRSPDFGRRENHNRSVHFSPLPPDTSSYSDRTAKDLSQYPLNESKITPKMYSSVREETPLRFMPLPLSESRSESDTGGSDVAGGVSDSVDHEGSAWIVPRMRHVSGGNEQTFAASGELSQYPISEGSNKSFMSELSQHPFSTTGRSEFLQNSPNQGVNTAEFTRMEDSHLPQRPLLTTGRSEFLQNSPNQGVNTAEFTRMEDSHLPQQPLSTTGRILPRSEFLQNLPNLEGENTSEFTRMQDSHLPQQPSSMAGPISGNLNSRNPGQLGTESPTMHHSYADRGQSLSRSDQVPMRTQSDADFSAGVPGGFPYWSEREGGDRTEEFAALAHDTASTEDLEESEMSSEYPSREDSRHEHSEPLPLPISSPGVSILTESSGSQNQSKLQHSPAQSSVVHISPSQISPAHISPAQILPVQISQSHMFLGQISLAQVSPGQISPGVPISQAQNLLVKNLLAQNSQARNSLAQNVQSQISQAQNLQSQNLQVQCSHTPNSPNSLMQNSLVQYSVAQSNDAQFENGNATLSTIPNTSVATLMNTSVLSHVNASGTSPSRTLNASQTTGEVLRKMQDSFACYEAHLAADSQHKDACYEAHLAADSQHKDACYEAHLAADSQHKDACYEAHLAADSQHKDLQYTGRSSFQTAGTLKLDEVRVIARIVELISNDLERLTTGLEYW